MGTKCTKKPLLEVIPPRICITLHRASFWFRPNSSKMQIWKHPGRTRLIPCQEATTTFLKITKITKKQSKPDPYSTLRAENQAIWISKVLPIQWDPSRPQILPCKIQNPRKIHRTPPTPLSTKFGHQPYFPIGCHGTQIGSLPSGSFWTEPFWVEGALLNAAE